MKCEICGKEIDHSINFRVSLCSSECFTDWFWLQECRAQESDPNEYAIIDGESYHFNRKNPVVKGGYDFLGFGGQRFKIRYNNGATYTTNNLWCQGEIPDKYRDRLKDNAVFVRNK